MVLLALLLVTMPMHFLLDVLPRLLMGRCVFSVECCEGACDVFALVCDFPWVFEWFDSVCHALFGEFFFFELDGVQECLCIHRCVGGFFHGYAL